ncbi:MAG: DUF502 domain-containing protein [Verrucomicrobiae bacterium]|nr:DUF502 domain-containing protein [Verrucomicrobiae bacterium]MCP5541392.1 DUF502 domain-containing protein [Akkermansiaceae bacterium]
MPLGNFKNSAARAARAVRGGGSRHWRAAATHLRNRFFTGFAVAIPLIVTIWLLVLSYRFILFAGRPVIDGGGHLLNALLGRSAEEGNLIVPPPWFLNLFGILVPVLIFIGLGVMATNVLGARVISLVDRLLLKFPVISSIYAGLKQVMDSFKNFGGNRNFQRVAYIEYPAPGCRLLGFVTGEFFDRQLRADMTSVFIPTSPNPMTGFVVVVESEKLTDSSLTIEEATKIILSAGLVGPEKAVAPRESMATGGEDPIESYEIPPVVVEPKSSVARGREPALNAPLGGETGFEEDDRF